MTSGAWARLLMLGLAGLAGCGTLPAIQVAPDQVRATRDACAAVFPAGTFGVVHALEVSLPRLNKKSSVIGVTDGDSRQDRLSAVLLTPEGMTVFEATYHRGQVKVQRSLPPLDEPEFATRLFSDVRLMLRAPPGELEAAGVLEDGRRVCRYRDGPAVVDVVLERARDGGYSVIDYGEQTSPTRELRAYPPLHQGFPRRAELHVSGLVGYTLRFSLLRVEDKLH